MVKVSFDDVFEKAQLKLDSSQRKRIVKLVSKIVDSPTIGKPMSYERKGTREVYMGSFRLQYQYVVGEDVVRFLSVYHKDKQ